MKIGLSIIIVCALVGLFIMNVSSFGTRPGKDEKLAFATSKQYNKDKGIFENRRKALIAQVRKRSMSWKVLKEWLRSGEDRIPREPLPEVRPDLTEFLKKSDELKAIWFGHSSFLLNVDGKLILVDPVFGNSAAPFNFLVQRFQRPVLELSELPEIDYILISHDHYDHLDMTSIKFFIDKQVKFITPLGVGSYLKGWGIKATRIIEKDWWQSEKFGDIEFIAAPAQHFSGRDGIHDNETLWASWIIKSNNHKIYFSGDSGYDIHFKEIGEKYGPFDVAFLETGQYNESWKEVHMLPEEAVEAYKDLKAKRYFPVHWGMFELALHAWYEPVERLLNLSKDNDIELVIPKIGQITYMNRDIKLKKWWRTRKSGPIGRSADIN